MKSGGLGDVSDLKKEAASLLKAASGLRVVDHHTAKPLQDFQAASHDLSALGALGSLLSATDDIRDGMTTLTKLTHALGEEWQAEAKVMGEVSDAFDLLDVLLAAEARTGGNSGTGTGGSGAKG
ncbi:hypothetical protein OK074_2138 [Actinobacteria bacterium OK074]|nr:hypothetical protein OK074_2138 [Actinobacteria bacterium OK074]